MALHFKYTTAFLLLLWNCLLMRADALPEIVIKGSKFFDAQTGDQFYFKATKIGYGIPDDDTGVQFSNETQCQLDAQLMRSLGTNILMIPTYVGATEPCFQAFEDQGIYVLLNIFPTERNDAELIYSTDTFKVLAAEVDAFARYSNVLGFIVEDALFATDRFDEVKASVQDLRSYVQARQYGNLPIGVAFPMEAFAFGDNSDGNSDATLTKYDFLMCDNDGNDNSQIPEFVLFWSGLSRYNVSTVTQQIDDFSSTYNPNFFRSNSLPIVYWSVWNNGDGPRLGDQEVVLGSELNGFWSGTVYSSWSGFTSFSASGPTYPCTSETDVYCPELYLAYYPAGVGSALLYPNYTDLSRAWQSLTPTGISQSLYSPSISPPTCPTNSTQFDLAFTSAFNMSDALPTVQNYNFATVSPVPSGYSASSNPTATSSDSSAATTQSQGQSGSSLSGGAIAGIVIGVLLSIILLVAGLFLLRRQRRRSRAQKTRKATGKPDMTSSEKPEMYAGPVDPKIAGIVRPKHELQDPTASSRHELTAQERLGNSNPNHELHAGNTSRARELSTDPGARELNSTALYEAGVGSSNNDRSANGIETTGRQMSPSVLAPITQTQTRTAAHKTPSGSNLEDEPQTPPPNDSALIEEADLVVQELGLLKNRKKFLTSQARSVGKGPEDMDGSKGDEWGELVAREERLKGRLEEIQRLRGSSTG